MNNTLDPFAPKTTKPKAKAPQNFAEALKSIGGYTADSAVNTAKSVVSDVVSTLTGGGMSQTTLESTANGNNQFAREWVQPNEADFNREAERRARIKELQATPIFDRRGEEVKREIKALQDQLAMLAKDLGNMGTGVQKAINEQIAAPGTYHVSFFEKLTKFVIMLRKQVSESKNWLEMSSARNSAKGAYWSGVQKGGTKFMLSQERYMATSAG